MSDLKPMIYVIDMDNSEVSVFAPEDEGEAAAHAERVASKNGDGGSVVVIYGIRKQVSYKLEDYTE